MNEPINGTRNPEIALFNTLNFLAECTALELCSIKLLDTYSQGLENVKPFRMERLRSLGFHVHGLELDVRLQAGSGSLCDALEQLLIRSETASLRKLSLHFYDLPPTSPINCVRLSPELTDLNTYSSAMDTVWDEMMDGEAVCPKLERLTLMHFANETFVENLRFMKFLRKRASMGLEKSGRTSTLKKLTIVCGEEMQLSEGLKRIREAGVDVVLTCTSARRPPKRISPFLGVHGQALVEEIGGVS
ncbi:hypothetical protein C8J56DRAFT_1048875 [Mycena floridula]|nr:hypothetical protein C8J56DRAFT_1048875 [Mycena floridula]